MDKFEAREFVKRSSFQLAKEIEGELMSLHPPAIKSADKHSIPMLHNPEEASRSLRKLLIEGNLEVAPRPCLA